MPPPKNQFFEWLNYFDIVWGCHPPGTPQKSIFWMAQFRVPVFCDIRRYLTDKSVFYRYQQIFNWQIFWHSLGVPYFDIVWGIYSATCSLKFMPLVEKLTHDYFFKDLPQFHQIFGWFFSEYCLMIVNFESSYLIKSLFKLLFGWNFFHYLTKM